MFKTIEYGVTSGIAYLTIKRPEVLNALNADVLEEINAAVELVDKDPEVKVLIITGEGRAFVAGADIGAQSVLDSEGGREWGRNGSAIFRNIELLRVPVIAAVNGFALGGGCELALACDIIIASEKAKFGQPEVSLGITPGFSGTQRLSRKVGKNRAMEMILTGNMITAEEALDIGLINKVVSPDALMVEAEAFAEQITKNGPIAVKYSKAAINRGLEMDLDSAIAFENELFALCFATEDQKEGMNAFLEKRKAEFKGK